MLVEVILLLLDDRPGTEYALILGPLGVLDALWSFLELLFLDLGC